MSSLHVPAAPAAAHQGNTIEIFINARPHPVEGQTVSFEQIVALAFPGQQGADTDFVVTYTRAQHGNESGSLAPGQQVRVKKGTSFGIQITTRS